MWWSGGGNRCCVCHDVIMLRQEGVREVVEGSSDVKTERVEWGGRGRHVRECLCEVVDGGV